MEEIKKPEAGGNGQSETNTSKDNIISPSFNLSLLNNPEAILKHLSAIQELNESNGLFTVRTANKWMEHAKQRPIPKMLFGEFWFEGELCILFADTNLGKSILAVQIGDSISKGVNIPGFKFEAQRRKVLYFDFEMGDKQFEARYSKEYENHYPFDNYFLRAEINPDSDLPDSFKTFEDYLNHSFEQSIIETGAKVLIIDNITYLKNETERAKDALPLMKHLKALKKKYDLSILALAHTPKRDLSKPITRNDLQGSKMLINFCDSSFSIGESTQDKQLRYLKQIKARNTEIIYDSDNAISCQLDKPDNFLRFEFIGYSNEMEHLRQYTDNDKKEIESRVFDLVNEGKSYRDIGFELGISHTKVGRIFNKRNTL